MTESPTVQFKAEFKVSDYYRILLWRSFFGNRRNLPILILFFGFLLVAAFLPVQSDVVSARLVPVFVSIVLLVAILCCPYLAARRIIRSLRSREFQYSFSSSGIDGQAAFSNTHIGWPDVRRARESTHYVMLFLAGGSLLGVPKRCLNADELRALRGILRDQLGRQADLGGA